MPRLPKSKSKQLKKTTTTTITRRSLKAKMYRRPRYKKKIDSYIHRFKELLRTKIVVNSDTMQVPANDDPAGTQYRYVSGKLEDFIDLSASSSASAPSSGNNKWLNNLRRGGLKTVFDMVKIDSIVFKFISPYTSSDMMSGGANNQQGTLNLYTSLDKDGGGSITSLYYMRERGNVRFKRLGGYSKVHKVVVKPWTDSRSMGADNTASVNLARPLGWFDLGKIYEGPNAQGVSGEGVPRLNLGHYFIEAPTDILGGGTAPAPNMVIDCQITVYYSCKNLL